MIMAPSRWSCLMLVQLLVSLCPRQSPRLAQPDWHGACLMTPRAVLMHMC